MNNARDPKVLWKALKALKEENHPLINDVEVNVPKIYYNFGKVKRHDLAEYCNALYQNYFFKCNKSDAVPEPPKRK